MPATASFPALGVTAVVAVTDEGALPDARALLSAHLEAVDRACSRFRADSDLMRVNARAGRATEVGELLFRSLRVALRAAAATGGLVDPTLGASMRALGYDRTFALVRARERWRIVASPRSASWADVRLDDQCRTVELPAGLELDLGATAKALAADDAARAIAEATGCGALVCLGGDLAVHGDVPAGGWAVLVADDHTAPLDADGPAVSVSDGGLATSGTTVRRWWTDAGEAHHILDPRTGAPARSSVRTATVAAASCVEANTAATAAVVLGDGAHAWLEEHRLPARLVHKDGSVLTAAGWPQEVRAA